ncbi:MAG: septal ring lytic transglycosylase RlpA family protein, partial [Treponema sp.]|nr:septal ring lytic transglycosylase RlpA family protein [Treponema sp.]
MVKKLVYAGLLGLALVVPVFTQQTQSQPVKGEGGGSCYVQSAGLFASHASLPFGTELIITNLDNGQKVTVTVGGRIPEDPYWLVDVSPDAADLLEMY